MDYQIIEHENVIEIQGLKNFNLTHIFENGQTFRWDKTADNAYIVVAFGLVCEFEMRDKSLFAYNTTVEDFINIWHPYFNLDTDYDQIKKELKKTKAYQLNDSLENALNYGYGLRILNQDRFETTIGFIISANNNLGRIKLCMDLLAKHYGDFIESYKGKDYYAFPSPSQLASLDPLEVRETCRVGFRDVRIVNAAKAFKENPTAYDLLELEELKLNLLALDGVGPKVLDCILLFGYGIEETFPIDVWVQRLMNTLYFEKPVPKSKVLGQAKELFGNNLGHAQQYLFYYARDHNIGKE